MNNQKQKILILGCGGFIGSHILERLINNTDHTLIGVDITADKITPFLNHERFEFHTLNVHDSEKVKDLVAKVDTVISLVALCNPALYNTIPLDVIDINFTRPLELVTMCAEMNTWLIHFSTCEVYGRTLAGHVPEVANNPEYYMLKEDTTPMLLGPVNAQRWSYACAKQLLERVIYAYGFEKNLKYSIIRPFNFIGPRMDYIQGVDGDGVPRVIACFMKALMKGAPLQLVDGGLNRRCFTFIDDAVDAVMAMLAHPDKAQGEIFNVGNPHNELSIAALAETMIQLYYEMYPETKANSLTTQTVASETFYGDGYEDSDRRVPDISKAKELLQWQPTVDIQTALKKTIKSYVDMYIDRVLYQK